MKFRSLAIAAVAAALATPHASADLVFPSLSYRTGPYGANGIPFADGYADYFTLVNERDGGIGGVPTRVIECETGYNTEKGVECYEATKGEGALVYQPLSTGITYQLIPKSAADGIPLHTENFIGVWWSGSENDVKPVGEKANGYKALNFHGVGNDYPLYADLEEYVFGPGKAAGAGDQRGQVLYNRGLYAAMLAVEAAKTAQRIHDATEITPQQMRDGMEALEITEELMTELGMPNFGPAFSVSCEDHGGPGLVSVQQWNAADGVFEVISDFSETDGEVIDALVVEDSAAFAAENGIEPYCG